LKRTLFFAYTAQVYISLIGILLMPLFLRLMGAEAFGLIGFFLMLQAWLQLLDLGFSPT
jgi:O-antigen/teichoic acid export membrane protein